MKKPKLFLSFFLLRIKYLKVPRITLLITLIALALFAGLPGSSASALYAKTPAPGTTEISLFFDGMLQAYMREKVIAGATLSVVKDGQIIIKKGYGYSDTESRTPVDPDKTMFMIGSVTKLFTATAVMQLVEQGRLDLNRDINEYIDFKIPASFNGPVTMRHLLTHTAGFEDDLRGLFTDDPARIAVLATWVKKNLPARVRPAGEFSSYSNYGIALAGYIVERVSRLLFDDYIEQNILKPLNMKMTSGRQPLPEHLAPYMSKGYTASGPAFSAQTREYIAGPSPAGSITSTAEDMAAFMIAHLNSGRYGRAEILKPAAAAEMHSRQFAHHDSLPAMALGFYEMNTGSTRVIGHSGGTAWFHTLLVIIPEHNMGFFVSFNTDSAMPLTIGPLLHGFLDRFFPEAAHAGSAFDTEKNLQFTGTYRFMRMSYTTFQKIFSLAFALNIKQDEGGLKVLSPLLNMHMQQTGPMTFREYTGSQKLAFRADKDLQVTHAFLSAAPMMALERVPWHGAPVLHFFILGAGSLMFLVIIVVTIASAINRKRRGAPPRSAELNFLSLALADGAASNLIFIIWTAVLFSDFWNHLSGTMISFKIALVLPVLGALSFVLGAGALFILWKRSQETLFTRIRFTIAITAGFVFVWSLWYFNLLGWNF